MTRVRCEWRWRQAAAMVMLAALAGCSRNGAHSTPEPDWDLVEELRVATSSNGATAGGGSTTPATVTEWGTLKGKFVYDGSAPTPTKIDVNKDQEVCGKHGLANESLVVGEDGGIANIVVFVRTRGVAVHPDLAGDTSPVKIDNKGCRFEPHVTVYQVSRPLLLHNSDPVSHNMNLSVAGDSSTNQLLQQNDEVEHKLKNARPDGAPVTCNIHPWMAGWIMPRDNPYFAVTGKDGSFEIKNLPAGKLEFQLWHEKSTSLDAGGWQRGRFTLDVKPGDNALGDGGVVKVDPALFNK